MFALAVGELPLVHVAIAVSASLTFGIVAKLGRTDFTVKAVRRSAAEAGALWIIAFYLCVQFAQDISAVAIISLGTGIAGSKAIDLLERAYLELAARLMGTGKGGDSR